MKPLSNRDKLLKMQRQPERLQRSRRKEHGEAVAFLASPNNELTSGALLPVYGRV